MDAIQIENDTIKSQIASSNINVHLRPQGDSSVVVGNSAMVDNLVFDSNTISSVDSNGDIRLLANTEGVVKLYDAKASTAVVGGLSMSSNTLSSVTTDANLIISPLSSTSTVIMPRAKAAQLEVMDLRMGGSTVSSASGDVELAPHGDGKVVAVGKAPFSFCHMVANEASAYQKPSNW